jgi:hypothetical protein
VVFGDAEWCSPSRPRLWLLARDGLAIGFPFDPGPRVPFRCWCLPQGGCREWQACRDNGMREGEEEVEEFEPWAWTWGGKIISNLSLVGGVGVEDNSSL